MILPGSHVITLTILLLGMLCWGTWANTFKLNGPKWRFELYYFDFAIGAFLCAILVGLTFGSLGLDGFQFTDDLKLAGKRQDALALAAGVLFNLGNMLLVASVSVAGMALAFPVGMGLAIVIGSLWNLSIHPGANGLAVAGGCALIASAILADAIAYRSHFADRAALALQAGKAKPTRKTWWKGVVLAATAGLLLGSFLPLVEQARFGENGLGPYSLGFVFAAGILVSTLAFNLFFMNLPIQGQPIEIGLYFRETVKQHVLGLLGGIFWYGGAVATFVAARAEGASQVSPGTAWALSHAAVPLAALCGLFVWKEFAGADNVVRALLLAVIVLLVLGIGVVAGAPLNSLH